MSRLDDTNKTSMLLKEMNDLSVSTAEDVIDEDEASFLENNKDACKLLIKDQGLVFWTRVVVSSRERIKQTFGAVYMSNISDFVFIDALRKLDCNKGDEKLISFLTSSYKLSKFKTFLPNFEALINGQKTSFRSAMKRHIDDVFSSKLIKASNDLLRDGTSSVLEKEQLTGKLLQVLRASVELSSCIIGVLKVLIAGGSPFSNWSMPSDWSSPNYQMMELEEYLKDKWRADLAIIILQVPQKEIGWWSAKRVLPEPASKGILKRVQNLKFKPVKCHFVPACLIYQNSKTLLDTMDEHHHVVEMMFKEVPVDTLSKLLFECYEFTVPPVLADKYHLGEIQGSHSLSISAWFASWCSLLEGPKMNSLLRNPPNSSNSMNLKENLNRAKYTLASWAPPKLLTSTDQISSASSFLELPHVRRQFLSNYTIRQQWLAVALSTVLKFELEAVPLQCWPLPREFSKAVIEVLSFIKMTKECILLALRIHEESRLNDLITVQKQLMPVIVHNLKLMSSQWADDCLQNLKSKCIFSQNGCVPPVECWKIDSNLDEFYFEHHWNFLFYKAWNPYKMSKSISVKDKFKQILNSWRAEKKLTSKTDHTISFRGLLTKDIYTVIKSFGWTKLGKFVKIVLGSLADMGYVSLDLVERFKHEDLLLSHKFDKPLSEMYVGDYDQMDVLGKISCHCLVLLQCACKFRGKGKILHNNKPKSLLENLVLQSLTLFELEHQHKLAYLAGQLCDFDPVSPVQITTRNSTSFKRLLDEINVRKTQGEFSLSDPFAETSHPIKEPILLESGLDECSKWLKTKLDMVQMEAHKVVVNKKQYYKFDAALLQYLFPCYLNLLDSPCLNGSGVIFLYQVLNFMLQSIEKLLISDTVAPQKIENLDIKHLRVLTWLDQNKTLQYLNAFVDNGSGEISDQVADIFSNINWILMSSHKKHDELLNLCAVNFSNLKFHFHKQWVTACLEILEGSIGLLALKNSQRMTLGMAAFYKMHSTTFYATIMLEADLENTDPKIQAIVGNMTAAENKMQWWRSMLYIRLSTLAPKLSNDSQFVKGFLNTISTLRDSLKPAAEANDKVGDIVLSIVNELLTMNLSPDYWIELCLNENSNGRDAESEGLQIFIQDWKRQETIFYESDVHKCNVQKQEVLSGSFDLPSLEEEDDERKKSKAKKYLKPSKAVLQILEKQMKQKERRICKVCKKKEGHKQNFVPCSECLKTKFPRVHHFCSKLCEKQAWETYHEEQHLLFALDMYELSEEEAD